MQDTNESAVSRKSACGLSLADFCDPATLQGLSMAESMLLEMANRGEICRFSATRPDKPDANNFIRSSFVRFLALGGDPGFPVHKKGVQLVGGWIGEKKLSAPNDNSSTCPNNLSDGHIDFDNCNGVLPISLQCCHIDGDIIFRDAQARTVDLGGSHIAGGIEARRARIAGSLYLRGVGDNADTHFPFQLANGMDLVDAVIDGSLECRKAEFGSRKTPYPAKPGS